MPLSGSVIPSYIPLRIKLHNSLARERLLNVNNWHHVAGIISAAFQVTDKDGKAADRNIEKGDYVRIDIPGPGSKAGDGYDWVMTEELKEINDNEIQSIGFRVRPAANPLSDEKSIAHFYDDTATSNFIITRSGNKVTASIIDHNVQPNDETVSLTDKIRDTAVGMSAIGAFSKIQWQKLANGLVAKEK
ncbi:MAG: hypothetical protein H0W12_05725 [Chitinophagaceae bacterium]|nr:hypothetical protein [Chitinophagaceae bacterium]